MKTISKVVTWGACLATFVFCPYLYAQQDRDAALLEKLMIASKEGDVSKVKSALALGVGVNDHDSAKNTPLHWAVLGGHTELVDYLLQHGASVDARDGYGATPLHKAVAKTIYL